MAKKSISEDENHYKTLVDGLPNPILVHIKGKVVYANDAMAKAQRMSAEQRLLFHQAHSGPAMAQLQAWMDEQIQQRTVEPNSGLGEAIAYMQKHWNELTLFLRVAAAPLDNTMAA